MDSADTSNNLRNTRGRVRGGLGRAYASPTKAVQPDCQTKHPLSTTDISLNGTGDSTVCSLSFVGRGRGRIPRQSASDCSTSSSPLPNFARGRGLGRSSALFNLSSNTTGTSTSTIQNKTQPETANSATFKAEETVSKVSEVKQVCESGASAAPPPMASDAIDCQEILPTMLYDSSDSEISDYGDDFAVTSSLSRAMAAAESDEDDMIHIGRQFRQMQSTADEVLPQLPANDPESAAAAACAAKKAQQIICRRLSDWRKKLREANIDCLDAGRDLEAELIFRWHAGHQPEVVSWLKTKLISCKDPCASSLVFMNWCGAKKTGSRATGESHRNSMRFDGALDVLESVLNNSEDFRRRLLAHRTVQSRRFAFFLGQRDGFESLRRMVSFFRLDDELAVSTMKPLVDQLLEGGVYKEACQFIGVLGLQQLYSPQQVLLPCIAEGRTIVVEQYVRDCETAQRQLLRFLDSNFDQQPFLRQLLEKCHPELLQVRHDFITYTALKKLTLRLQKMFQQPNSVIPRISGERCSFDLCLLLHERYVRRIKRDDWMSAIQRAVGDSHENAVSLVEYLMDYRLPGAARRWADFYNVTANEVASLDSLKDTEEEEQEEESYREEELAAMGAARAQNDCFLAFPLDPDNDIEFVQEEEDLWMAIGLASRAEKIGFDAEWTTLYGQSETSISLLQMALPNCVFILDMQRLPAAVESEEVWHYFRSEVFEKDQVKIFYSALQDMQMIWASIPDLKTPAPEGSDTPAAASYRGVVDLEQLMTHCSMTDPNFFPSPTSGGLSGLVQACLGRPLCKTERLSNWRARPLTRDQRIYAALDALCLISVHDWMETRKKELHLDGLDLRMPADLEERKKKKKKKKEATKADT